MYFIMYFTMYFMMLQSTGVLHLVDNMSQQLLIHTSQEMYYLYIG